VHRSRVTDVPSRRQLVVVRLRTDPERAVLGVVPAAGVPRLQVEPQLVAAAAHRQLTEQIVAEAVVAAGVVEPDFVLRPRTVEEVGPVDVLLDQQGNAAGCEIITSITLINKHFATAIFFACTLINSTL